MRKAGVGIILGPDMVGTELPPHESMTEAYQEARLLMAQVAHKDSLRSFRVLVYYGHSGSYAQNAAETMAILNGLAESPDVATIVAGLKIPQGQLLWEEVKTQGIWRDPHAMGEDEQDPFYTCWPPIGEPSKLDYILVNAFFVAETCQVGTETDSSLPTHVPLYFDTPMAIRDLEIVTLPKQFPRPS